MYCWRDWLVFMCLVIVLSLTRKLGPITVLNKTIFNILKTQDDAPDYLQFIGWVYLWGAILHWITAALNCKSTNNACSLSD